MKSLNVFAGYIRSMLFVESMNSGKVHRILCLIQSKPRAKCWKQYQPVGILGIN